MHRILWAIVLLITVLPLGAMSETYVCKIRPDSKGDWIPETLAINHDPKSGKVIVNDDLILFFHKKPLVGRVATENAKRITFTWILPSVRNSAGQRALRFRFRASYLKATHKMIVSSQPSGYENRFRGSGVCNVE